MSLLACLTVLAACDKEATGQVAAVVNGEEITLQEINTELEAMSVPEGADKTMIQKAALQRIIDRRLLAQAAREEGLDQTPEFVTRSRQMEEGLLVQILGRNASRSADVPDQAEISAYIEENPALFADRTVYTIDRIQFPMPADPEQLKAFEDDETMEAVVAQLRELGIEFTREPGRLDSAQVGQEAMNAIVALPRTEPFIFPEGGMVTAAVITGEARQPTSGDQAQAAAVQVLQNQGLMTVLQRRLKAARDQAEIEYQDDFRPPASPGSASGNAATAEGRAKAPS
ncbi:SurA N-terminal domain-containing protein [Erythrobacter sp. QSSC1-22B]|uniref:SurA N-terminal domain-containing protein n=1 Tax=Erythrobacter sp. QSSC1-22B TaxID=1860125 RepID=UPI0014393652|nr:SurA N-terminal domain-containing protein [Erythrobacter sp. QSSC1-22B]